MADYFDIPVFRFINHDLSCPVLGPIMKMVSNLGGGELFFALGVAMLFFRKREIKMLGVLLIAGLTITYYMVSGLKILIARPRPFAALSDVIMLAQEKSFSFPSNHAATAFMAATLLSKHFKHYAVFYLLAAIIAFSRIYLGVHYPTDVIAGAVLGVFTGFVLSHIAKLLVNGPQSMVHR